MNEEQDRLERYEAASGQRAVGLLLSVFLVAIASILHLGVEFLSEKINAPADSLRVLTLGGVILTVVFLVLYMGFLVRYPLYDSKAKQDPVLSE